MNYAGGPIGIYIFKAVYLIQPQFYCTSSKVLLDPPTRFVLRHPLPDCPKLYYALASEWNLYTLFFDLLCLGFNEFQTLTWPESFRKLVIWVYYNWFQPTLALSLFPTENEETILFTGNCFWLVTEVSGWRQNNPPSLETVPIALQMAIAMKYRAAVTAIVPFFTVLLGDIPGIVKAELLWEKMQMAGDGVLFNVAFRDGGYTKPYRMKFIEDGILSIYKFKADGCVTNIKVGSERYEPVYDSSLDLTDVIRTERRSLAEHEEDSAEYFDEGTMFGKRLLFSSCDNCVSTWDAVCGEGVPCVCSLLDFESELSPAAIKSFKTMCETFGSGLCSSSGGFEACTGQCSDDGVSLEPTSAPTTETGTSYTETGTSSTATGTWVVDRPELE